MASEDKQYTFRLPSRLVARIDQCLESMQSSGLTVNRTDIVRMLLTRALDSIAHCSPDELLSSGRPPPSGV